jgi:predicted amidohydrolase
MKSFVISIGQMQCDMDKLEKNEEKIVSWMQEAASSGSKLLILPEMSLTGYQTFDRYPDRGGMRKRIDESLLRISETSRRSEIGVLVSYPIISQEGIYIASSFIDKGETIAVHKKINLCNYAHYAEHLHFIPGDIVTVTDSGMANFGVVICEDSWHLMNAIVEAQLGAEVLLNPSAASVSNLKDVSACLENWKKISIGTAFSTTCYFILCNQAGPTNDGVFMGGSHVIAPDGNIVGDTLSTDETLAHIRLDGDLLSYIRSRRPLIKNERMDIYSKYCR